MIIFNLRRTASTLRLLAHILEQWKIIALAAFFLFPEGSHIRIQDKYGSYPHRYQQHHSCVYLGARGLINHDGIIAQGCPLLVILNANQYQFNK